MQWWELKILNQISLYPLQVNKNVLKIGFS